VHCFTLSLALCFTKPSFPFFFVSPFLDLEFYFVSFSHFLSTFVEIKTNHGSLDISVDLKNC
jgi:hypothetical protein